MEFDWKEEWNSCLDSSSAHIIGPGFFGRTYKVLLKETCWNDIVINCSEVCNGRVACSSLGGENVGVFVVPPEEQPFAGWLGCAVMKTRTRRQTGFLSPDRLRLLDPQGCIFCTINLGDASVAVKQIRREDDYEGLPSEYIREVSLFQSLRHEHIVPLLDFCMTPSNLWLVFELMDCNLHQYIQARDRAVSPESVKNLMNHLVMGMKFIHANGIMHRDIKPQHLFVRDESMKICGFGLARSVKMTGHSYTQDVIMLWYRPLEILLGSKLYSMAVDMWSCGCVLAEMALGEPIFRGDSEIGQIFQILQTCGTPTEHQWPGVTALPHFRETFPRWEKKPWSHVRNLAAQLGTTGLELLDGLLDYDPTKRIPARKALKFKYLETVVPAC